MQFVAEVTPNCPADSSKHEETPNIGAIHLSIDSFTRLTGTYRVSTLSGCTQGMTYLGHVLPGPEDNSC